MALARRVTDAQGEADGRRSVKLRADRVALLAGASGAIACTRFGIANPNRLIELVRCVWT